MMSSMPYKIPESVLVVIHTADLNVLLMERADAPGYWQSVTGSKDTQDEALRETCRREVLEETGLRVTLVGAPSPHEIILRDDAGTVVRHYLLMVFAGFAAANADPACADDALDARFMAPAEAERLPLTSGLVGFMTRTRRLVNGR